MKTQPQLQIIEGNQKEGVWMHDPSFSQEDIDFINEAFKQAAEEIDPSFEKLIWNPAPKQKLKRIK